MVDTTLKLSIADLERAVKEEVETFGKHLKERAYRTELALYFKETFAFKGQSLLNRIEPGDQIESMTSFNREARLKSFREANNSTAKLRDEPLPNPKADHGANSNASEGRGTNQKTPTTDRY